MTVLDDLIRRGYFPKELPPSFSTRTLTDAVDNPLFVANNVLQAPQASNRGQLVSADRSVSLPISHILINPGKDRRLLKIPHPTHYYYLCKAIQDNWNTISGHYSNSGLSLSIPRSDPANSRAFVPSDTGDNRPFRRIRDRARGNTLLICDIAGFYDSIYTHCIPWAFHSKSHAKQVRNDTLFGNVLDKFIRNGQDQQTRGIPIGPDTSLIISEAILASIDHEIISRHSEVTGFRFYDDYEIVCEDESSARALLITIEECLGTYELQLNNRKTQIVNLPEPLDHEWISALRNFSLGPTPSKLRLVDFADLAFRLSKKHPYDPVLRYALAKILFKINATNVWGIYQDILLQMLRTEPQLAHLVAHELVKYSTRDLRVDKQKLRETLYDNIVKYSNLGASNEVAWSIWMCLLFRLYIIKKIASFVTRSNDSFAAVLTLDAIDKGLIAPSLDVSKWSQLMREDEIYSENWLLTYEAAAHGWLPIIDASDYINSHTCFGELYRNGVRFYSPASLNLSLDLLHQLNPRADMYGA